MTHPNGDTALGPERLQDARIFDAAGRPASVAGSGGDDGTQLRVLLADGTALLLAPAMLAPQPDGSFRLPFAVDRDAISGSAGPLRFPVQQEIPEIGTRRVETGTGIRLHKHVTEHIEQVEQTVLRDELVVEKVAVGQPVAADDPPRTRYEGDTLVVPVLEEVLVVQKQLLLREELRITRRRQPQHVRQGVPLRAEQVDAERFDER